MRILHLTPELPYAPGGTGGATRQFHLLRRLVELGHEVTVVSPAIGEQLDRVADLEAVGVRVHVSARPSSRVVEVLRAMSRDPRLAFRVWIAPVLAWQVEVFWVALRPQVLKLLASAVTDVVIIEHDHAVAWRGDLGSGIPVVLSAHNVSWHYYARRASAASGARRWWMRFEAMRSRRYVGRRLRRFDAVVAVSDRDAEDVRLRADIAAEVVPNGVDTREFVPVDRSNPEPVLLFTGSLNYPPNEEGIVWFVQHVWPLVRARAASARLQIVGRNPTVSVRRLANLQGVSVEGSVPSMTPYFNDAMIAIVPLRSGGGTRLKVVEALASGLPVVSTTIGAEGIDLISGEEIVFADRPEEFAGAVTQLIGESARRERLARAGREAALRYDWQVLGERLEAVLRAAVEHSPALTARTYVTAR